jgi:hypothetical protein
VLGVWLASKLLFSVAVYNLASDRELLLSRSTNAVRDCYCRVFIHPMVGTVGVWRYHTAIVANGGLYVSVVRDRVSLTIALHPTVVQYSHE